MKNVCYTFQLSSLLSPGLVSAYVVNYPVCKLKKGVGEISNFDEESKTDLKKELEDLNDINRDNHDTHYILSKNAEEVKYVN